MSAQNFIHKFVPAERPDAPTILLLHGTGGDETDLLQVGHALDPHAALLSPRGKVLERGMPRFFRRLAEGVFDLEDLRHRTEELADFVTAAASRYGFDPSNVVAAGFSNGANIAASLLLLRPGALRGAVLFHPMVPLEPETPPDLHGVPVFIGAGRLDSLSPPEETERLVALLHRFGADVAVHWIDGGHTLTSGEVASAAAWLREVGAARLQPA
jgi:predicted esterase